MNLSRRARFFKWFLYQRKSRGAKFIGNPAKQRQEMNLSMQALPKPFGVKYQNGFLGGVRNLIATPKNAGNSALLYLHGGGYVIGRPENFSGLFGKLAKLLNASAYAPDYRLAPEHTFPAAIDDSVATYKELLKTYAPENIYVAGDSAGGNLSIALCLKLKELALPQPKALYVISPFADMKFTGSSLVEENSRDPILDSATVKDWAEKYAGNESPANPLISVCYADYSGLPPMLIQVGSDEVLRDDSYAVKAAADQAGIKAELHLGKRLWHDWQIFWAFMPEAKQALISAASWLKNEA